MGGVRQERIPDQPGNTKMMMMIGVGHVGGWHSEWVGLVGKEL